MRYFRLTKYFRVEIDPTGSHWNIDLESSREEEINQLLEMYDGHALKFKGTEEYLQYLSDIEKPELPWEKKENLKKVAFALKDGIIKYASEKNIELKPAFNIDVDFDRLNKAELNNFIMALRTFNLSIREVARKNELLSDFSKLAEIIKTLRNVKLLRKFEPEQFEKLVVDALKILNDEILIKPNYPVDDNGEPINHASPNKPDIECYYEKYNAVCEVTLRTDKLQWIQETNPVMRHLRDFENQHKKSNVLCLFIAPLIHKDTLSIFWYSIKSGYDGPSQKIIPFTTEQFATLLEIFYNLVKKGKRLRHNELYDFYLRLLDEARKTDSFTEWVDKKIPLKLNEWKQEVIAQ